MYCTHMFRNVGGGEIAYHILRISKQIYSPTSKYPKDEVEAINDDILRPKSCILRKPNIQCWWETSMQNSTNQKMVNWRWRNLELGSVTPEDCTRQAKLKKEVVFMVNSSHGKWMLNLKKWRQRYKIAIESRLCDPRIVRDTLTLNVKMESVRLIKMTLRPYPALTPNLFTVNHTNFFNAKRIELWWTTSIISSWKLPSAQKDR